MNPSKPLPYCLLLCACGMAAGAAETTPPGQRQLLSEDWQLKSSVLVPEDGARISAVSYRPQRWFKTVVPSTVLSALVKNGVYPDPRSGLDCYRIPDSSDEFNRKHDLARFSYLPDQRNPWRDPYWYRTEFGLPQAQPGQHVWLNFNSINYRADVWLNGVRIADKDTMGRPRSPPSFSARSAQTHVPLVRRWEHSPATQAGHSLAYLPCLLLWHVNSIMG